MIPMAHPLANVRDTFNAILLNGSAVGDVMFYGRGAGDLPTASAVISDILFAAHASEPVYATFENDTGKVSPILHFEKNWKCPYYIRLNLLDKPGVLSRVTGSRKSTGSASLPWFKRKRRGTTPLSSSSLTKPMSRICRKL